MSTPEYNLETCPPWCVRKNFALLLRESEEGRLIQRIKMMIQKCTANEDECSIIYISQDILSKLRHIKYLDIFFIKREAVIIHI